MDARVQLKRAFYYGVPADLRRLFVDDDPSLREFAAVHLATENSSIETAADGEEGLARIANDAGAGAIATVRRALGSDQHQDPVRVAMDQAGHGAVAVLAERVVGLAGGADELAGRWYDGATERVVGVEEQVP